MQKQKGFTIIELLVVIAIIAVLAAIVLVNVTKYLNKGKDAGIEGNLAGIMTNAAVYFDDTAKGNGTYTNLCSDSTITSAITAAKTAYGASGGDTADCNAAASAWAACSQLKDTDSYFCVDSTGAKKTIASGSTCVGAWTATACP